MPDTVVKAGMLGRNYSMVRGEGSSAIGYDTIRQLPDGTYITGSYAHHLAGDAPVERTPVYDESGQEVGMHFHVERKLAKVSLPVDFADLVHDKGGKRIRIMHIPEEGGKPMEIIADIPEKLMSGADGRDVAIVTNGGKATTAGLWEKQHGASETINLDEPGGKQDEQASWREKVTSGAITVGFEVAKRAFTLLDRVADALHEAMYSKAPERKPHTRMTVDGRPATLDDMQVMSQLQQGGAVFGELNSQGEMVNPTPINRCDVDRDFGGYQINFDGTGTSGHYINDGKGGRIPTTKEQFEEIDRKVQALARQGHKNIRINITGNQFEHHFSVEPGEGRAR